MGIKSFFKDVGNAICNVADKAATQIDDAIDIVRIQKEIGDKQKELDGIYAMLGKKVMECTLFDEVKSTIDSVKDRVATLKEEITNLETQKREKTGKRVCPFCNEEIEDDADYCHKCGAKIEK